MLGRDDLDDDPFASRRHVRLERRPGLWLVEDLASRNGTILDGRAITGMVLERSPRTLRIGETVALFVDEELERSTPGGGNAASPVPWASRRESWDRIAATARTHKLLYIAGERGTGHEAAAHHFHLSAGRSGPFVAVNCASLPTGLAEELLFGTGTGSAGDPDGSAGGLAHSADGGTLFLDDFTELELGAQQRLLRLVQSGELFTPGAASTMRVDVAICVATHRDVSEALAARRVREDLFHAMSRPRIELPPLRAQLAHLPGLVTESLAATFPDLLAAASLIEAVLLREWPGNATELRAAIDDAARSAILAGRGEVTSEDLWAPVTGTGMVGKPGDAQRSAPTREEIEIMLRVTRGNITEAARRLRVHRTSLRRWMARYELQSSDADPA